MSNNVKLQNGFVVGDYFATINWLNSKNYGNNSIKIAPNTTVRVDNFGNVIYTYLQTNIIQITSNNEVMINCSNINSTSRKRINQLLKPYNIGIYNKDHTNYIVSPQEQFAVFVKDL